MAVLKSFRAEIVNNKTPQATVLADLGSLVIPFLGWIQNITSGYKTGSNFLEGYVDSPDQAGGAVFGGDNSTTSFQAAFGKLLEALPLLVDRTPGSSGAGYYLRIKNGNGSYAITTSTIPSVGSTGINEIYDSSGNLISNFSFGGVSASGVIEYVRLHTCVISNGTITQLKQYIDVQWAGWRNQYNLANVGNYSASAATLAWINALEDYAPPPTDPYSQGGESDTGGGTGNFDGTSVDVDFAQLPTLSAVDTGFITLYNPSLSQLQSLASYMWSGLFDIDTLKKLFGDPMQAILGLSIVPGPVPGGTTQNVKIGNVDSGVTMTKAASQYIDVDCGTLNVEEFWGAYLDYEPYTKAEIYLPFIGVHQIAIDDIMNKSVHIKYHIDLLSGGCACEIKCGGSVLYTFLGSCAVSIPITGSDWTNTINGVLSAAASIGTMVATGGAATPSAASTIASAAVNALKPSIEKSGSVSGAGGLLAGKVPVLILTRPRQALPGGQNTYTGYPAFITRLLGELTGYTEVHSIRLSGIDGTESEIEEIEELLKGGVIL